MTGTVAGMTVWGIVYASLGGASRSLLKSGVDLEELIGGNAPLTHPHLLHPLVPLGQVQRSSAHVCHVVAVVLCVLCP